VLYKIVNTRIKGHKAAVFCLRSGIYMQRGIYIATILSTDLKFPKQSRLPYLEKVFRNPNNVSLCTFYEDNYLLIIQ